MDIQGFKDYIIENDLVPTILEALNCHHIKRHENYYSCGNPDGDNANPCIVFTSTLAVVNYTRDLDTISKYHDIFTLVQFYRDCNFFDAIKYVCEVLGISTYYDFNSEIPESLALTKELLKMIEEDESQEYDKPLNPIPEEILSYYISCVNDVFAKDNIPYSVQQLFEIGYDPYSNRITIPIRNYDGVLVGVKGRYYGDIPEGSELQKYIYLEPCNKGQVLYGLDKTYSHIQISHCVYVGESEKFVMQLYSYGDKNCVSTGGKTITRQQIEMLSRMCVDVILCLDKDVGLDELKNIGDRFIGAVNVFAVVDQDGLLGEKESPSDDVEKWRALKNCLVKIRQKTL